MSSEKMSWAAANLKYAYGRVTTGTWEGKKVRVLLSSVHELEAEVSLVIGPHEGTRIMSVEEIVFDDPVVVAKAMEENFLRKLTSHGDEP
ncbi:hypothetical protein KJ785_03470 [Patescibacteria group bacterium]|nr:hypothetical protein [Patescibacteria group bacterium]